MSGSVENVVIDLHSRIVNSSLSRGLRSIEFSTLIMRSCEIMGFLQSRYEPVVSFDEGLQRSIDYYRSLVR